MLLILGTQATKLAGYFAFLKRFQNIFKLELYSYKL